MTNLFLFDISDQATPLWNGAAQVALPTMGVLGLLGLCAVLAAIGVTIVLRGAKDDDDEDEK